MNYLEKKLKLIFNFLTSHEGFYMDQYESEDNKKLNWIGLKKFPQGIYAIIITDDDNAVKDEISAKKYLNEKIDNYSLHVIILSRAGYNNDESITSEKIVINSENNNLLYASKELLPLANVIIEIINPKRKTEKYKKSSLTLGLIAINIILFIISSAISGNIFDIDSMTLLKLGAKYNPAINNGEVWRLITAAFLHGGIMHLACNMYSLYIVGSQIEVIYGKKKYIIIYFFSALGSSGLSYLLAPRSLSVGASGAIFGLMGALLVFVLRNRKKLNKGIIGNLIAVIAVNLYIGLTIPNIDNFGHIGGLIIGIIIAILLSLK